MPQAVLSVLAILDETPGPLRFLRAKRHALDARAAKPELFEKIT